MHFYQRSKAMRPMLKESVTDVIDRTRLGCVGRTGEGYEGCEQYTLVCQLHTAHRVLRCDDEQCVRLTVVISLVTMNRVLMTLDKLKCGR